MSTAPESAPAKRESAEERFVRRALALREKLRDPATPGLVLMAALVVVGFATIAYAWFGTVDEICDKLRAARERWGTSYFVLQKDAMDAMAPVVAQLAGT